MNGKIKKALSGFYYVEVGDSIITCRARGRFRKEGIAPLVGDVVELHALNEKEGIIEEIKERRNAFERPAVANIDQLVIVISQALPQADPYLVDRMTAIASLKNCDVLICINKCDLDPAEYLYHYYQDSGFSVICVSAKTQEGLQKLSDSLVGKLSAFTGNSGVGKSSLLNALDPSFSLRVGEISQALQRGKHTTRHVELYTLVTGAEVIDTPGFSSFDTESVSLALKEHLPETFPEFSPYLGKCRFVDCSHTKEKDCAILAALSDGKIIRGRHESYCRLYEELKNIKKWDIS